MMPALFAGISAGITHRVCVMKNCIKLNKMASGGEDGGNNREIEPEEEELAVVRDTEGVFRHFMFQRYQDETERGEQSGEMNTSSVTARPDALEELRSCNDVHGFSQNVPVIGQRLGEIGDEIDAKYKDQFKDMIDSLSLTPATAYETFAAVARRLFRSGINWGRIVALLCFGYEIAVTVIRRGFSGNFLRRIIRFVVDFIFNERIARWIAQHGGWRGVLDFRLSEPSWYTIGIVLLFGTLFAFFATKKTGT